MILNGSNTVTTNLGCLDVKSINDYSKIYSILNSNYDYVDVVSIVNLGKIDSCVLTTKSGFIISLPLSNSVHNSVSSSISVRSLKEGDDILLSGAYPNIANPVYIRVPPTINENEYIEVDENIAEIFAVMKYYSISKNTKDCIFVTNVPEKCLSVNTISLVKSFGGTVLANLVNNEKFYSFKIANADVCFIFDSIESKQYPGISSVIKSSSNSVCAAYLNVFFTKFYYDNKVQVPSGIIKDVKSILLSKFGVMSYVDDCYLRIPEDVSDISSIIISPFKERYDNVEIANDALSFVKDTITSIKKVKQDSFDLLLSDESFSILVDNVY